MKSRRVGVLYKAGEEFANESTLGLADPDAAACFKAYRQLIDHSKHGGGFDLPQHLRDKLKLPPAV